MYDEEQVILFVKDTGSRISDNDRTGIFDFFRQGKQKRLSSKIDGIGVGLSIVKILIDLLHGEIWFESEKGKGSSFFFKIKKE